MLSVYTWSVLITGLLFTSFGLFALYKNTKDKSTILFSLLSAAFAVWSFSWYFMLMAKSSVSALFFAKLLNLGATLIPVFYLHWIYALTGSKKISRRLIVLCYIVTIIFSVISFSDFYIPAVRPVLFFPFWPVAGNLYTFFLIVGYFGFVAYSIYILAREFILSTGQRKMQLGFVILGSISGFVGGATNFPLMYGYDFMQPFGVFGNMVTPILLGYAALNFNLMNIRSVAVQFFLGAMNIFFIINLFNNSFSTPDLILNISAAFFAIVISFIVIRYISVERKSKEKIESLAKELAETNERQEKLIHFVGHEVKGYLTKGEYAFAEMIDGDFGELSSQVKTLATVALTEVRKGVQAVTDILKAANLKQGTVTYEMKPTDIRELVREEIIKTRPQAEEKGLKFGANIDETAADWVVNLDGTQFGEHVIRNLIDNSIKYTLAGSISVGLSEKDGKVLFYVKDTGVGINDEDKTRLFTEGGRGKDSIKINVHSTGYGLYIAKQVVEAHHGRIWAESDGPGKGSTFKVELNRVSLN